MPLVCPLRHPYLVEESWNRRRRPIREMLMCFRTLVERYAPLNPYIMPVDSDLRQAALEAMAQGLGLPLATDWPVINSRKGTQDLKWYRLEPSPAVRDLVEEIQPFLSRWY